MNISEKIALECGAKISTPKIDEFFLPIKNDNYIIIDARSRFEHGEYDYFNDVVELIREPLSKNGIEIFYFSTEKMVQINCDRRFINLNKKQESYLIKKAKLVIACENYSLYLAAALNIKSIGLYSIYRASNFRPAWNKESQVVIESNRDNNLPTYGTLSEEPKTINFISPFEVAKQILNSLRISNDLNRYTLLHIGEEFGRKSVEIVPDFTSDAQFLHGQIINLRLDYVETLSSQCLEYWLFNRKANIITDKDIHLSFLQKWKSNILCITVYLSDRISELFLQRCRSEGLQVKLLCNKKEELEKYRFKFLDWEIDKDFPEEAAEIKGLNERSLFVSSKVIFSKGKRYSCKSSFLAGRELDKSAENVILDGPFKEEMRYFKIYNYER